MLLTLKKNRTTKPLFEGRKGFGIGFGLSFNPNFDGNALAWYDGNFGLSNVKWSDIGSGGHDIGFTNTPTIVPNATPLRDSVRFNGVDESGKVTLPAVTQPHTIYLVLKSVTWTNNRYVMDDGLNSSRKVLKQLGTTPDLDYYCGASIVSDPDLAVGTWGVMTLVANGVNSEIRTNLNASVTGDAGALNGSGISLGASPVPSQFGNVEFGYVIIRTGADTTSTQNKIINGLRKICGLTF